VQPCPFRSRRRPVPITALRPARPTLNLRVVGLGTLGDPARAITLGGRVCALCGNGAMAVVALRPNGVVRLLSTVLWELPSLPDAACPGPLAGLRRSASGGTREQQAERLDVVVTVCRRCPELAVRERLPLPQGGGASV
jgi:hypothetical protein